MKEKQFKGVFSAIFSLYDREMHVKKGEVSRLVDYHIESGLNGFYVCGNTGECSVLPENTRMEMLETVVSANRGRGLIMAHVGATHFNRTKELLEHANGQKIDAVASLPPALKAYYNTDECIDYYEWMAKNSTHPVYAYVTNAVGDPVALAERLAKIPNVGGIKLTICDYYAFSKITAATGDRLNILNGPDETMICGLSVGADGAIGTTYNYMASTAANIYANFMKSDLKTALSYQRKLNEYIKLMFGSNIAKWKSSMRALGFDVGYTVFPAREPTAEEYSLLYSSLQKIGIPELKQ